MAITAPDQLVELLDKSKLLDEEKIAQAKRTAQKTDSARALAKAMVREGWITGWQALQLLAGRSAFYLGKYKLIELLGSGGMGRVFVAEHTTMGRRVALKILPKRLGKDPALLKQFLAEARAIAALDHPHIVHPYDVANEADRYYLVMQYVEGQDLQRMVEAHGPLRPQRAARYVQQAAEGLAHAHSRDMIHCDVKPANLVVNQDDVVKILDLGMARLLKRGEGSAAEEAEKDEKDERLLGTVDYLAPEQAIESPDLDHRVDVYSLGCTLYFLLTGRPPFPEGTLPERILKHQNEEPRKIRKLRPDVPEPLAAICERMMAKDPDARFPSADAVGEALDEWLADQPDDEEDEAAEVILEPAEGADAAAADVAAGSVAIDDEAEPADLEPSDAAAPDGGLKGLLAGQRRLVLFGSLGGVAVLMLTGGLLLFLGGGGGDDSASQVAAADAGSEEGETAEEEPLDIPEVEVEATENDEWPSLPNLENLRDFDPQAAFDNGTAKPKESEKPAPEKAQPKQAEKPEAKAFEGQAKPEAAAAKEAAAEKPATEKPAPEKPEAEKPEPKAAEKAPPQEKPAAKEAAKAKPKPPPDPLGSLPEVVDLPELAIGGTSGDEAPGEVTLGKISTGPDVGWQLYLVGGDVASRPNRAFALKEDPSGPGDANWRVVLETVSGDPEPTARLRRDGNQLKFQWDSEADPSANYLRNCILQVRVEGESKYVALTEPVPLEPIVIDLEIGGGNVKLPVKWLPDAGTLRIAVTKVEGREGHVVEPAEPADPDKPVLLSFPRTDRHGNTADRVAFRLDFSVRTTSLGVKLQLMEPPRNLFRNLRGNAPMIRTQLEMQRDQVDKQLHPKNKEAPRGRERSTLNAQLDRIEHDLWYVDFYQQVHDVAEIYLEVFSEVDGRKLVLATTRPSLKTVAEKE